MVEAAAEQRVSEHIAGDHRHHQGARLQQFAALLRAVDRNRTAVLLADRHEA
jgi:hypothetical protein